MSSRSSRLALVVLLAAATVMAPLGARAESAKDAYGRGLSLYAAGKYHDAADAFLAAYRLKPKPLILFNVGQAFRKQGDLDQALTYYRRFLDEASPDERAPLEEEVRKYVHEIEAEQALKRSLIDKADTEEANKLAFPKKSEPPPQPPAQPQQSQPQAQSAPAEAVSITASSSPPQKQPVYKSWWLWTAVGAVAAGVAIGVGVGVGTSHSNDPSTALGTRQPSF